MSSALAQQTHLWTESSFNEWESGIASGVAIGSDGTLTAGFPATTLAELAPAETWAAVSDKAGNLYVATGTPAEVIRVSPKGAQTVLFTAKDLSVQALALDAAGHLYAATTPSGKVYRLDAQAAKAVDAAAAPVVFDSAQAIDKPKYIWAMSLGPDGALYVATGAPAAVYRLSHAALAASTPATPELIFSSDEPNLRSLAWDANGNLLVGSDGNGLVYRIPKAPADGAGKGFVIFEADKREITSMALGPNGELYVAAVGQKGRVATLPPLPVAGPGAAGATNARVTVTIVQPGSTQAVSANAPVPEGSEIDLVPANPRLAPRHIWADPNDVVYDLKETAQGLLAATGNHGRILRIGNDGSYADVAQADAAQAVALAPAPGDTLYVATSSTGKVQRLSLGAAAGGTLLSDVFDPGIPSAWGRAEVVASGAPSSWTLETRVGNLDNPSSGWTAWKPWNPGEATIGQPDARFVQWRLTVRPGAAIQSIGLNLLQANAAPSIDEILVAPGTRVNDAVNQPSFPQQTVLNFASQGGAPVNIDASSPLAPLSAIRDKSYVTVRWAAHDDNGDTLRYALYYRATGDTVWRLLKDHLHDPYYSFSADLLPDGAYRMRVVATDAPSNPAADALTGERISDLFYIDTATPTVTIQQSRMDGNNLHVTATATDARTPIAHAEYSVDAGPWQYVDPVGRISDALTEQYDFSAPLKAGDTTTPHLVTLRVFDRYGNVGVAKADVP